MISFFLFLLTIISFFWAVKLGIKSVKAEKVRKILKKEGIINSYVQYIEWVKERNPWGGFVSIDTMRKNLIKEDDSEELKKALEESIKYFEMVRKRMFITLVLFLIMMFYDFFIE